MDRTMGIARGEEAQRIVLTVVIIYLGARASVNIQRQEPASG